MSATNATANYELPVFLATDKPAWLTDWNGAMNAIDTAIHTAQSTADGAQTTASTATTDIATINSSLSTITSNITSLTTTVNGNTGAINTINSLIGNGEPTTDDKTIIGAINEIYAMIGGGSTVTASIVTYDNTTSGLSATNVQSAIDEIVAGSAIDADDVTYDNTTSGLSATDVQSAIDELANGGVGGTTYTTTEVDTGDVWTNGKHIFRKCFYATGQSITAPSVLDASLDLTYIENVISIEGGTSFYPTGGSASDTNAESLPIDRSYQTNNYIARPYIASTGLNLYVDNLTVTDYAIIVEYTKA